MPSIDLIVSTPIVRTPRTMQIEGMFDIQPSERSAEHWQDEIPIENREWQVGMIVGPSGCGKSTIAKELFGNAVFSGFEWDANKSIIDGFPGDMRIGEITELLSSVGFSSPPLWLRPYRVLSTGQKMRVDVARLLAEQKALAIMDEFTSVVDRVVAQIGSAAIAKTVRRRNQKFVAVTCHYDVIEWLQPDWIYEPHKRRFLWRSVERRPAINLEIQRVHHSAWEIFRQYHYLDHSLNKSSRCFVAFYQNAPIAFVAVLSTPHRVQNLYRVHRAVCLPDFQGVGIGSALIRYVAGAYKGNGKRLLLTTANATINAGFEKDARWRLAKNIGFARQAGRTSSIKTWNFATQRLTATWEFIGESMNAIDSMSLVYDK